MSLAIFMLSRLYTKYAIQIFMCVCRVVELCKINRKRIFALP